MLRLFTLVSYIANMNCSILTDISMQISKISYSYETRLPRFSKIILKLTIFLQLGESIIVFFREIV